MFKKATKTQSRLRLALYGPSGAGKSYTALRLASGLRDAAKIAAIDTERGSLSKYSDEFDFDVLELDSYEPDRYISAIAAAGRAGYTCLIIDSLSHAWSGAGGLLDQVDNASRRSKSNNSYFAWREVTPQHNRLVDAMLQAPLDVIVTMRAKTEYVVETDSRGKSVPRKIGLAPVQREGMEYEFDVVGDMQDGTMIVTKSRCRAMAEKSFHHPGEDVAAILREWIGSGAPAPAPVATPISQPDEPRVPEKVREYLDACNECGVKAGPAARALCEKHGVEGLSRLMDTQIDAAIREMREAAAATADTADMF